MRFWTGERPSLRTEATYSERGLVCARASFGYARGTLPIGSPIPVAALEKRCTPADAVAVVAGISRLLWFEVGSKLVRTPAVTRMP